MIRLDHRSKYCGRSHERDDERFGLKISPCWQCTDPRGADIRHALAQAGGIVAGEPVLAILAAAV
jgi:hypothetical protein